MRRSSLSALIALAVLLPACQSAPPEYPLNARVPAAQVTEEVAEGEEGEVDLSDAFIAQFEAGAALVYTDAPAEVAAGPVAVQLILTAAANHNVVFEDVANEAVLVEASSPGEYTSDRVVDLAPGSYVYYCSVPTHREAGMEGTLEAVEGLAGAGGAEGEEGAEGEDGASEAPAEGEEGPGDAEDPTADGAGAEATPAEEATEEG